jgi:hypothetical protein
MLTSGGLKVAKKKVDERGLWPENCTTSILLELKSQNPKRMRKADK